jgi:hypothetical protein
MQKKPLRFPRLRRSAKPPKVDQRLVLKGLEQTGQKPKAIIKSQNKKLRDEGRSPLAISYIRYEHELPKEPAQRRGPPFLQGGRVESNRGRH